LKNVSVYVTEGVSLVQAFWLCFFWITSYINA